MGSLLLNSGAAEYKRESEDSRHPAELDLLGRTPSPALDSVPLAPLFYVHLGASQRSIVRDAEDQIRRWKARRGGEARKVHTAKTAEHMKVWDLREGWHNGHYDRSREHTFAEIAKKLKRPLSTITSRYRRAFELVVGHPFKPELWWQVFGPLKFSRLCGNATTAYSAGTCRRLRSPAHRPVPDSVVGRGQDENRTNSTIESLKTQTSEIASIDLRLDLKDLIGRGLGDEEIARRLDLKPDAIAEYRSMSEELQRAALP